MNSEQKTLLAQLRQKTGIGFIACKKALEKSNWHMDQAIDELKKVYKDFVIKKSQVKTDSGLVIIKEIDQSLVFSVVRCQTDTVPRSPVFIDTVNQVVTHFYNKEDYQHLIEKAMISFSSNITIDFIKIINCNNSSYYLHNPFSINTGSQGAIVQLEKENKELAKQIAMNVVFYRTDNIEEILNEDFVQDSSMKIKDLLQDNKIVSITYLSL